MTTLESGERKRKPLVQSADAPINLDTDAIFPPRQVAAALNISLSVLKRMWAAGEGPTKRRVSPHRVGSKGRDIAAYLEAKSG